MSQKAQKKQFQKDHGLTADPSIALILVPDYPDSLLEMLENMADGLKDLSVQIALVDPHDQELGSRLQALHQRLPKQIIVIQQTAELDEEVFDVVLLDDLDDLHLKDLKAFKRVPLASSGLIQGFDPVEETGNGFCYQKNDFWSLYAAVVRLTENYRFSYDWGNIVKAIQRA